MPKITQNEQKINESLLGLLLYASLEDDHFSKDIVFTRITNRFNQGLIEFKDILIVYQWIVE